MVMTGDMNNPKLWLYSSGKHTVRYDIYSIGKDSLKIRCYIYSSGKQSLKTSFDIHSDGKHALKTRCDIYIQYIHQTIN